MLVSQPQFRTPAVARVCPTRPAAPRLNRVMSFHKFSLLRRLRFRRGFFFLRQARAGSLGDSCGQPVVVRGSRMDDNHALARDDIFADVFAVIAACLLYTSPSPR